MNKNKKYLVGKIDDYSHKKGWFFGFFSDEPLLRSDNVEIAYQDISGKKPASSDWHYHKIATELNIVTSGSVSFKIDGNKVNVEEGGFWVVKPGAVIEELSASKNTKLIIIKTPSIPNDKFSR